MNRALLIILTGSWLINFLACARLSEEDQLKRAEAAIRAETLARNIQILASDEFEGRAPASEGEKKTLEFLQKEFKQLGLKPGNGSSYFQPVPMVVITADPLIKLEIKGKNRAMVFQDKSEFIALTRRVQERVILSESELVFAGYGIVAPEYDWNDYEGFDVRGKTVLVLINDPGFVTQDPKLFNGRAMTYYGRWTYKYEEAARQGAAGIFIIHETEPAAYPWQVVENSWTGPQFHLIAPDNNLSRCAVEGWLQKEVAEKILQEAGYNLEDLKKEALMPDFKPIPLSLKVNLSLNNKIEKVTSHNVIALWPGKQRSDEYLIFVAHWDHFGRNPQLEGDQIFNGALDNASGTAALIELARAFTTLKKKPWRSIVFLSVTGEEQGLLGSEFYAANPIYPPEKTIAVINLDALNIYGPMKDITVIGYGLSDLDKYIEQAAQSQGRTVNPDPTPEKGSYFRSDHFPFAKRGIPAIYPSGGVEHLIHGRDWTLVQREKYIAEKYHQPSDEFDPSWDLSGAIDDLKLLFRLAYRLANEAVFPNWHEGTPYKAKREAALALDKAPKED
ncbi:MAG: M28 family metallopeptidase [Candidatus Aminicenantes bacterium]|nr:M28 family metallopeptidase [Candidatus Aminicenantes bacterium]